MFKRRPSLFGKGAPPVIPAVGPSAAAAGGEAGGVEVKRRTSFFRRTSASNTSTALPSGSSTPYPPPSVSTNGGGGADLSRSESLPEIAPPPIRKRSPSEDSASIRSSLEDTRRQEVESPEGDLTDEGEHTEGLMGRGTNGHGEGVVPGWVGQPDDGLSRAHPEDDHDEHDDALHPLPSAQQQPSLVAPPLVPLTDGTIISPAGSATNGYALVGDGLPADTPASPPLSDDPSSITRPSLPSPTVSTTPSTSTGHHHHHHHHHSPPLAAPPPLRASTISAVSAPLAPPKKPKTFMGMGGGKAKKEAAAAAALADKIEQQRILDEMTPAQKVERAKQAERAHLLQTCMQLGLEIYDIAPDGHCLYAAIADQLWILRLIKEEENNPTTTRKAAAEYMLANPDSFLPFLIGVPADPDDVPEEGEDPNEPLENDGMMTMKGYKRYCRRVQESGEWGGEPEILALSRAYNIPIHVIQSNHPKIVAHSPDPKANATLDPKSAKKIRAVRISYHRRLYGLGEHYNSLRKIQYQLTAFSAMVYVN